MITLYYDKTVDQYPEICNTFNNFEIIKMCSISFNATRRVYTIMLLKFH